MKINQDTTNRSSSQPQTKSDTVYFWLILGLGAILRLATLGRQSLWLDEGTSYWLANRSWQALLTSLPSYDPHPPLHYLILQPMIALGGNEWLLRLPSALAGIASIGLLFALGKELFDRKTALTAAFILAISPFHLWFAQEARMYALVAALSLAAGLFAARALRTNRRFDWLVFGLCEGLALLADTAAIWFVLAANTAWLLSLKKHWRAHRFWPWIAAQLLALLLYLPWLPNFLQQFSGGFASWIPPATLTILARTLTDFIGSYEQRSTLESIFALVVLLTPLVIAARQLFREASTRKIQYVLLGCWFLVPIGLAFLISQPYLSVPLLSSIVGQGRSIFLTRNLIVASFPLYLWLARSLILSRRLVLFAALVALVAMSGVSYYQNVLRDSKEDYRTAAQMVREQATPDALILFVPPYLKLPFAYYYDRSPFTEISLDTLTDGVIGDRTLQTGTSPVELLDHYQRVWLITNSDNIYREDASNMKHVLETQGSLLESRQVYGVSIFLYQMNKSQ